MKPFDLKAALAGEPVVTREGIPINQLVKFDTGSDMQCLRAVYGKLILAFNLDGTFLYSRTPSEYDLFMATKKRTVWINLYDPDDGLGMWCSVFSTEKEGDKQSKASRLGNRAYPIEIEE